MGGRRGIESDWRWSGEHVGIATERRVYHRGTHYVTHLRVRWKYLGYRMIKFTPLYGLVTYQSRRFESDSTGQLRYPTMNHRMHP